MSKLKYTIISFLPWIGIIVLYIVTRLYQLTILPIFTDEAIYIRWSQIGANDAAWRFISLTDGKQPLFTWIMMVLFKILHADPLFIGRFVSVIAGLFTVIGLYIVTQELFRSKLMSYISSLLYVILPFGLFYDRLAIYDSLVAAISIWNLFIIIRLVKKPSLDLALIYSMTLALGMLNKSAGFFSLYSLPFSLLLFDWKSKFITKRLLTWVLYAILSAIIANIYYSVLRLSPLYNMIGLKNNVFVFSLTEWLNQPFRFLIGNLKGLFDWQIHYLTTVIFIFSCLPIFVFWKNLRVKLLLYIWWGFPFFALALFGKVLYPRFILFMSLPLYILSAYAISTLLQKFQNTWYRIMIFFIISSYAVYTSYFIVTDPIHAPIPNADRGQMIDDWPAGGGIKEVNAFLKNESTKSKIVVYTDGTFGLLPYAIEIYLVDNPNIEIHGIWPLPLTIPNEIIMKATKYPVYIVTNQYQKQLDWPIELLATYKKGTSSDVVLRLFKVKAPIANQLLNSISSL